MVLIFEWEIVYVEYINKEFYKIILFFFICILLVFFVLVFFDFLSLGVMNFSENNLV